MLRWWVGALLLLSLAAPSVRAQTSPEAAIQDAIARGNAAQVQAIAQRTPGIVGDAATGQYARELERGNASMLSDGISTIELVKLEWGPIDVKGNSASAVTFETWRTSYAAGPTEFARDRNVYTLTLDGDVWRITGN